MIRIRKDHSTSLWHLDQEHGTSGDYDTWHEAMEDAQYLIDTARRAYEQRKAAEARMKKRKNRMIERRLARLARREGELA